MSLSRKQISEDAIAAEVQRIREKHGDCTPTTFVDEARNPESPVHDLFDWERLPSGSLRFAYPRRWWNTRARQVISRLGRGECYANPYPARPRTALRIWGPSSIPKSRIGRRWRSSHW